MGAGDYSGYGSQESESGQNQAKMGPENAKNGPIIEKFATLGLESALGGINQ